MCAKRLTYKDAGVDIHKGNLFVQKIAPLVKSTARKENVGSIGEFSGLFSLPQGMKKPLLVAATDGVGTKLLVAQTMGKHDTIGIDLVAMCVNDLVVCGAQPLFFLDYLATGKLDVKQSVQVVKGIAKGCKEAGCSLIGGETAEMPDLYKQHDYDLAGFSVGVVDEADVLNGSTIQAGDLLLGLASSGIHSNGYSLVRKLFSKDEIRGPWGKKLLKPTKIYVRPILNLTEKHLIKGAAHITGGGFYENIPRCLPPGTAAQIDRKAWRVPPLFTEIQKRAGCNDQEMFSTFNMGIGMVLVIAPDKLTKAQAILKQHKIKHATIGQVVKHQDKAVIL